MGLPGVKVNVLDGNLGLQPASNEQTMLFLGCSLGGTANTLTTYGDLQTMQSDLVGGELLEAAGYCLAVSGGPVMVMPLSPDTEGGLGSVTHSGTGTGTLTVSGAPYAAITVVVTTSGALGTGKATYQIGSGAVSQPVALPSGHTYAVPGTYTTISWGTHNYTATESYVFATDGSITYAANGSGGSTASPTQASSPVDYYSPTITVTTGGALATMQFTYSLDGTTTNTSANLISAASGLYAIPNTGVLLTFAGTFTAADTYSFQTAGPTFSSLSTALTALETTYLAQDQFSMASVIGGNASAAAWGSQASTLETAALSLFNNGVYMRFFNGCPTVNTVLPNAGSITIDSADTDSVVIAQRASMSAPHVCDCAGDAALVSPLTGLTFRRNALWVVAARAASVEASQNLGYVGLGGLPGVSSIYRDENATLGFDAAGITCLRTFSGSGANGFYITDAHTGTVATSDYYRLTNARVIDLACGVARLNVLPLVNSKVPTKGGGVITEKKAQQIEGRLNSALQTALVNTQPQDAVAASSSVNRTHNILADGNLIIAVAVQPFAYARTVTVNIGMAITA